MIARAMLAAARAADGPLAAFEAAAVLYDRADEQGHIDAAARQTLRALAGDAWLECRRLGIDGDFARRVYESIDPARA